MTVSSYFVNRQDASAEHPCALSVLCARPDEKPLFLLQILHGISERKERYLPLLEAVTAAGGMAVIHDLRGHGHSVSSPEELGYYGDFGRNYEILFDDIDAVYASAACTPADGELLCPDPDTVPALPRILLGFSMGALIASLYMGHRPEDLAGVLLAGLPHREPLISPALAGMRLLGLLLGEDSRPKYLNRWAVRRFNPYFEPEPGEPDEFLWLSNDPENRHAFAADPLCNHRQTINVYASLLRLVRDAHRPMHYDLPRPPFPLLLLAGENDPVAGGDRAVLGSADFLRDLGYPKVQIQMYRGFRHEIFRDTGREQPLAAVTAFCLSCAAPD